MANNEKPVDKFLNDLFDNASHYFSRRPGLLPLIGILLIALNFIVQLVFYGWSQSHPLLHLGLIVAMIGFLIIRPLE